jgi:hypothetical protein
MVLIGHFNAALNAMGASLRTAARLMALGAVCAGARGLEAQSPAPQFKVIAFHTGKNDPAHISFVNEANNWFPQMAALHHFSYEATTNWNNLNAGFLSQYKVVLFLDTRPEAPAQRRAGDYPVVWTNRKFKMIYLNMGHNDMPMSIGSIRPTRHCPRPSRAKPRTG